mgnify:CR=1 FL=1
MRTYAIAMWDFSWLERPEYDDWDKSLDQLQERGYDALRIECYPAIFPATQIIDPVWSSNDWGSPEPIEVESFKLLDFLSKCASRDIKVGLSTWWRGWHWQFSHDFYTSWTRVLDNIKAFEDSILFVDLTNEFPHPLWTKHSCGDTLQEKIEWADKMIETLQKDYNYDFGFCTSYNSGLDLENSKHINVNLWIASTGQFHREVGYSHNFWSNRSYDILVEKGESVYRAKENHFKQQLAKIIEVTTKRAEARDKYLICTEGWGPIDYKDYPGLSWDWVKEICAHGVKTAVNSNQFKAICTSNFCGPQFKGMWDDIEWHKNLTKLIKA